MKAYKESIQVILTKLSTDSINGLSQNQVIIRQKRFGKNLLPKKASDSIFKIGIFSNYWLLVAIAFVLFLQLLLYTSIGQFIFKTIPLTLDQWGLIILITFPLFIIEELRKVLSNYFFAQ